MPERIARKGVADAQFTVTGIAAHSGVNHERGRSAILELAHLIVALESLNGTIPGVTLNVGHVLAGERANVVPDRAFARFELRAFERSNLEKAIALVEATIAARTVAGTEVDLQLSVNHWPMQRTPAGQRLVELAREIGARLGLDLRDVATGGASDGNTAAAAGRPVLDGLGPVGGGAHSPDEYILIDSIVPRTALLAGLVATLSGDRYGKL